MQRIRLCNMIFSSVSRDDVLFHYVFNTMYNNVIINKLFYFRQGQNDENETLPYRDVRSVSIDKIFIAVSFYI